MPKLFRLEVYTPDREFFTGDVECLIFNAAGGDFEVLHHTFPVVTTLIAGVMKIKHNDKWMEAATADGFVRVAHNKTTILAQMCAWPHEVDQNKVNSEILELDYRAKKAQSLKEYKMAKAQLAIQLARLKIKNHDI